MRHPAQSLGENPQFPLLPLETHFEPAVLNPKSIFLYMESQTL